MVADLIDIKFLAGPIICTLQLNYVQFIFEGAPRSPGKCINIWFPFRSCRLEEKGIGN